MCSDRVGCDHEARRRRTRPGPRAAADPDWAGQRVGRIGGKHGWSRRGDAGSSLGPDCDFPAGRRWCHRARRARIAITGHHYARPAHPRRGPERLGLAHEPAVAAFLDTGGGTLQLTGTAEAGRVTVINTAGMSVADVGPA